jgi:hypothetical protein
MDGSTRVVFFCYQAFFGLQLDMPCVFMDVWCVCVCACVS